MSSPSSSSSCIGNALEIKPEIQKTPEFSFFGNLAFSKIQMPLMANSDEMNTFVINPIVQACIQQECKNRHACLVATSKMTGDAILHQRAFLFFDGEEIKDGEAGKIWKHARVYKDTPTVWMGRMGMIGQSHMSKPDGDQLQGGHDQHNIPYYLAFIDQFMAENSANWATLGVPSFLCSNVHHGGENDVVCVFEGLPCCSQCYHVQRYKATQKQIAAAPVPIYKYNNNVFCGNDRFYGFNENTETWAAEAKEDSDRAERSLSLAQYHILFADGRESFDSADDMEDWIEQKYNVSIQQPEGSEGRFTLQYNKHSLLDLYLDAMLQKATAAQNAQTYPFPIGIFFGKAYVPRMKSRSSKRACADMESLEWKDTKQAKVSWTPQP